MFDGTFGNDGQSGNSVSQSFDNIFGGQNVISPDGSTKFLTADNATGGQNFFDNGQLINKTSPNIFDGQDIMDASGNKLGYTRENALGSYDVVDANGKILAIGIENTAGGHDLISDGDIIVHTATNATGIETVLNHADPLAHIASYVMPPFRF